MAHVEKLGRGLRAAADGYLGLTGSLNGRLLPRAHHLLRQGVRPSRHRPLPRHVPGYLLIALGAEARDAGADMGADGGTNAGDGEDHDDARPLAAE